MTITTIVSAIICLGFVIFLVVLGVKALRGKTVSGIEGLIGETGKVLTALEPEGIVYVKNEDYTAVSKNGVTIETGEKVKVVGSTGAKLIVEKAEQGK